MSTDTDNAMQRRKAEHISICVEEGYEIEQGSTGFEYVRFAHRALPEIAVSEIDPSTRFLGVTISMPLMISSMTGGSREGFVINKLLAQAAQEIGIPVGMGSMRILIRKPELVEHFQMKRLAPDVPVIANIGAVQLRDIDYVWIVEMLRRIEVQAIAIHLNAGQELFQPEGERDFRGLLEAIARFCDVSPLPVIVKETGCGILPCEVDRLLDCGADYVNIAGTGGTNWIQVESYRLSGEMRSAARQFAGWGNPTAAVLEAVGDMDGRIIASGGIRTGMDVAKSIAMGASLSASALPFIRAVHSGGIEEIVACAEEIRAVLIGVMLLTASPTIGHLRFAPLLKQPILRQMASELRGIEGE